MAQREYRFFLNDPENPDEEEEESDGEDAGPRGMDSSDEEEVDVDVEGIEDHGDMRHVIAEVDRLIADDNGHAVDNGSDAGSVMDSLAGDEEDQMIDVDEPVEEEEDNEDAMTWESLSTVCGDEPDEPVADEWYPMESRTDTFPNFALPTTTRHAFRPHSDSGDLVTPNEGEEEDDDESSEKGDEEFQSFVDQMRPEPTKRQLAEMVLDYFLHHGYSEVIETYCREMDLPIPVEEIREMEMRNDVKKSILEGNMEEALNKLNNISPKIIKEDWGNYIFRKQHIIEMIRGGLSVEAVAYFREHLMINGKRPCDERMEVLERIFTLMVFADNEHSEFHVYYEQKERENTAKEINGSILVALGKPRYSRIDMLAKSIVWVRTEVMNTVNPNQKTTTVGWASKFFDTPFGFNELIEKVIKREPLDLTKEFS